MFLSKDKKNIVELYCYDQLVRLIQACNSRITKNRFKFKNNKEFADEAARWAVGRLDIELEGQYKGWKNKDGYRRYAKYFAHDRATSYILGVIPRSKIIPYGK